MEVQTAAQTYWDASADILALPAEPLAFGNEGYAVTFLVNC